MRLLTTKRFGRDLKRAKKRGKDLGRLWAVVDRLLDGQPLDPRHRQHRLSGAWSGSWECPIEPDWLLIVSAGSRARTVRGILENR